MKFILFLLIFVVAPYAMAKDEVVLGVALKKCAGMVTIPPMVKCESPAGNCPQPKPVGLDKMRECVQELGFKSDGCEFRRQDSIQCNEKAAHRIFPEIVTGCSLYISLRMADEYPAYVSLQSDKKSGLCKVRGQDFEDHLIVNSAVRQKDGTWKLSKPKFGVTLDKYFSTDNTVITSFYEQMPWIGEGVNQCLTKSNDDGYRPRVPVARHFGGTSDDGYDIAIVRSFRTTKDVKICGKNIKAGSKFGIDLNSRTMCKSQWPDGQVLLRGFQPSLFPDIVLDDEDKSIGRKIACVTDPGTKKPWSSCECDVDTWDMLRD